jgi:flagellar basal-body rod protein FlgF
LANPDEANLVRGLDGLFNNRDLAPTAADTTIRVVGSALENSNVSVVSSMVNMISLARQFDTQLMLAKKAENNNQQAAQLFRLA